MKIWLKRLLGCREYLVVFTIKFWSFFKSSSEKQKVFVYKRLSGEGFDKSNKITLPEGSNNGRTLEV